MQVELGIRLVDYVPILSNYIPSFIPPFIAQRLIPILDTIQGRITVAVNTLQDNLEAELGQLVDQISVPLRPVIQLINQFRTNGFDVLTRARTLVESIEEEYVAIRDFKQDTKWKGRVVSVPHIVEKIQILAQVPSKVAGDVKDLVRQVRSKFETGRVDAEEAVEELEGIEDFRGAVTRFVPKLAKGFEKFLGVFALVVDAFVTISATLDDLQDIVNEVREVRNDIEHLDLIFLSQLNPRKVISSDRGPIKIRLGHLHPTE